MPEIEHIVDTTYCTPADVYRFLRIEPFVGEESENVNQLIFMAEDEIDNRTLHSWREKTITNEIHNLEGRYTWRTGRMIFLNHRKIREVLAVEYWDGSSFVSVGEAGAGYDVNFDEGVIMLRNLIYRADAVMRLRMSYKFGETSVPGDIKRACIMMVASNIAVNDDMWFKIPAGADMVGLRDKISVWDEQVERILENRAETQIGLW